MKTFKNIIVEEITRFLSEYMKDDEVDWNLWEKRDEIKHDMFMDFLYENTPNFDKHIPWRLIQYPMLKKVWEDYMRYGFLRNTKPLDKIESIMIANTLKIDILTELAGHSSYDPEEDFKDAFTPLIEEYIQWRLQKPYDLNQLEIDYEKGGDQGKQKKDHTITPSPHQKKVFDFFDKHLEDQWEKLHAGTVGVEDIENKAYDLLKDRFYEYYMEDPKSGQAYISDYGLEPLMKLVEKLRNLPENQDNIGERIVTLDKMLNVVHMRSDMASWFVKGGSEALSDLSASPSERAGEKQYNEGVGDAYAEKKFNIPNPDDEFEKKYQQHQKTQTQDDVNGEFIGKIIDRINKDDLGNIYKNPKSLKNFEPNVRAVSDSKGNVYVAQLDYPGYHSVLTRDVDIGSPYDSWNNITWYRIGESNMFGFSISFMDYYKGQLQDPQKKQKMGERMMRVNQTNPTLIFMPFYWHELRDKNIPPDTLNDYLNAFNKVNKLKGY